MRLLSAAGLALALVVPALPAAANHEGTYAERVRHCATQAYALVESIITLRESISVAIDRVGPLPTANDQRLMQAVARATAGGPGRLFDNHGDQVQCAGVSCFHGSDIGASRW